MSIELPLMDGLEIEVDELYELNKSSDAEEGRRAFLEKRTSVFAGRYTSYDPSIRNGA